MSCDRWQGTLRPPTGARFKATCPTLAPPPLHRRVTSLTRSASARRRSLLRLVQQSGEAEGRREHSLPPAQRPLLRAQTQPLPDGGRALRTRSRRSSGRGGPEQECSTEVVRPLLREEGEGRDSPAQMAPAAEAASCAQASSACGGMGSPAPAAAATAGGSSASREPAPPSLLPPPLLVMPGAVGTVTDAGSSAAEAAGAEEGAEGEGAEGEQPQEQAQQAAERKPVAAERPCSPGPEAQFGGLSAAEEAAALPSEAPAPASLAQQGCTNVTVSWAEWLGRVGADL